MCKTTLPQLVKVEGWVINLSHITKMTVDLYGENKGCMSLLFFGGETMTIYRHHNGGSGAAAFDALLRFYNAVPHIEKVM